MVVNLFNEITFSEKEAYSIIYEKTKNIHIHDYQLGVLVTYRNLPVKMKNTFYSDESGFGFNNEFFLINSNAVKSGYICNSLEKIKKSSKRIEIIYDLNEIFDRKNYKNAKKYNKYVSQGLNYFEKNNVKIRELTTSDKECAHQLYERWVDVKMKDGKTFRNLFPKARYKRCLDYALDNYIDGLLPLGVFIQDKLCGFRILYIRDNYCYDLAYCTERNEKICTDFSEKFNICILKKLKDEYKIEFFNCGLSDGSLKKFKQHFPNKELIYYRTGLIK